MKKAITVGLGIGIPIILIVIIVGLNIFAISNLQFRGHSMEEMDILDMSIDGKFEVCNPTFFPASFDTLKMDINYKSTNFGTFTIWGKTIPPQSPTIVDGRANINGQAVLQLFIAAMGSAFGGQGLDFDPNQIRFSAVLDAPILGIIPFSISQNYSSDEFQKLMQGKNESWSCEGESNADSFEENIFTSNQFNSESQNTKSQNEISENPSVVLGSEHEHAAILVKIFGDRFDFSEHAYQIKSSLIHFEGGDGNTIHRHATNVPLETLFESLKLKVDNKCFTFQDGRQFCTTEDYSLKFYVNGNQVNGIQKYVILDGDRILISYGSETQQEIQEQLNELNSLKIIG